MLTEFVNQYIYQKLTSRGTLTNQTEMWNFATSWSEHPFELLTFFIPSLFGLYNETYLGWKPFVMTTDYIGVITIILVILGIILTWKKNKFTKFYFIALVIMILYSFGKFFPEFYKIFYNYVPQIKKFRVPSTVFLIMTFVMIYFAYYGIIKIIEARNDPALRKRIQNILIVLGIGFILLTVWVTSDGYLNVLKENLMYRGINVSQIIQQYGVQGQQYIDNIINKTSQMAYGDLKLMWVWFIAFIAILFLFLKQKIKAKTFLILLGLLIMIDLYRIDMKFIQTTNNYDSISKLTDDIQYIKKDTDKFRILPVLDTNEANKWVLFDIESLSGYSATGLKVYEDVQKSSLFNNLKFLGLLNTKYILSEKPFKIDGLDLVYIGNNHRYIYKNKYFNPRYFLADQFMVEQEGDKIINLLSQPGYDYTKTLILEENPIKTNMPALSTKNDNVQMTQWSDDKIEFHCKIVHPCLLFLSEVYYPKWKAYVDNKEIKIFKTDYLFRSVLLSTGEYNLKFEFYNNHVYLITTIIHYLMTLLAIIIICLIFIKSRKSEKTE